MRANRQRQDCRPDCRQDCAVLAKYVAGLCFFIIVALIGSARSAGSAELKVYLEGAYSENSLVVQLYANTDSFKLVSAGVKILYDSSQLSVTRVQKNGKLWSISDGNVTCPYMEPDISNPGEIVIILGKLDLSDPTNPTKAVTGERVLLAEVEFACKENSKISPSPLSSSPVNLDYARSGNYRNFVTIEGKVLDHKSVTFGSLLTGPVEQGGNLIQRGDADGNGTIDDADMDAVDQYIDDHISLHSENSENAHEWMDCNNDGIIDIQDINCINDQL